MADSIVDLLRRTITAIENTNLENLHRFSRDEYDQAVTLLKHLQTDVNQLLEKIQKRDENSSL